MINKDRVKRILVISLSNVGDAVLTTPVIQVLRGQFPQAHLAVLVGPRAFGVFKNDQRIDKKIIYDKSISGKNRLRLIRRLRQDRYDLVVDLRQTLFGVFLGSRYRTSILGKAPQSLIHMKDRHLWKLKSLGLSFDYALGPSVEFSKDEQNNVQQMLDKWQIKPALLKQDKLAVIEKGGIKDDRLLVAVSPGARNMTKCWQKQGYQQLIERLMKECHAEIIIVGDEQDLLLVDEIISQIKPTPFNACGKTTIGELAYLLSKCRLLITNDSAPMHLAWAVNTPAVAIFGPTDYKKYAPCGPKDIIIRKDLACAPCEQSLCPKGTRDCMRLISVDEVFQACKKILNLETSPSTTLGTGTQANPFDYAQGSS